MEIIRTSVDRLRFLVEAFPVVCVVGPRQVGKTTLVEGLTDGVGRPALYLDLESSRDLAKLSNAELYFDQRSDHLIILDEIQRRPDLFPLLRAVIDRDRKPGRFMLLGSASPELMMQSAESLAGRIAYLELHPFIYAETRTHGSMDQLWLRGGFPDSFLARDDRLSMEIREQFIKTYLERELALLGLRKLPTRLSSLFKMLAHLQSQQLQMADLARALGMDVKSIQRYLDFFEHAFLIRRLPAYHANIGKRLVKAPRIFIRDTGILHALLGIINLEDLAGHPIQGSSWESFVVQQILARLDQSTEAYYYRTQNGTELDLLLVKHGKPVVGIEVKLGNAPSVTKGTTLASEDLGSIPVWVVTHSTPEDYALNSHVQVTSFERIFFHLEQLKLLR